MSKPKRFKRLFSRRYSDEQLLLWLSSGQEKEQQKAKEYLQKNLAWILEEHTSSFGKEYQERIYIRAFIRFLKFCSNAQNHPYIKSSIEKKFELFFKDTISIEELQTGKANVMQLAESRLYKRLKQNFSVKDYLLPDKEEIFNDAAQKMIKRLRAFPELNSPLEGLWNTVLKGVVIDFERKQNKKRKVEFVEVENAAFDKAYETTNLKSAVLLEKAMRMARYDVLHLLSLESQDLVDKELGNIDWNIVSLILNQWQTKGNNCYRLLLYLYNTDEDMLQKKRDRAFSPKQLYPKMGELGFGYDPTVDAGSQGKKVRSRRKECQKAARNLYQKLKQKNYAVRG